MFHIASLLYLAQKALLGMIHPTIQTDFTTTTLNRDNPRVLIEDPIEEQSDIVQGISDTNPGRVVQAGSRDTNEKSGRVVSYSSCSTIIKMSESSSVSIHRDTLKARRQDSSASASSSINEDSEYVSSGTMVCNSGASSPVSYLSSGGSMTVPKYKYKGKSVKSNSVGIVEIGSVRHTVVGGSILCHAGSTIIARSEAQIEAKRSAVYPGIQLVGGRHRRRSQSRICRLCRIYRDGMRRHR